MARVEIPKIRQLAGMRMQARVLLFSGIIRASFRGSFHDCRLFEFFEDRQ
jgi:hypothetical protein